MPHTQHQGFSARISFNALVNYFCCYVELWTKSYKISKLHLKRKREFPGGWKGGGKESLNHVAVTNSAFRNMLTTQRAKLEVLLAARCFSWALLHCTAQREAWGAVLRCPSNRKELCGFHSEWTPGSVQ